MVKQNFGGSSALIYSKLKKPSAELRWAQTYVLTNLLGTFDQFGNVLTCFTMRETLIRCLLLLPLWTPVIVLCFVVRFFMSILVLQLSSWARRHKYILVQCYFARGITVEST